MDWTYPRPPAERADASGLDEVLRRLERWAGSPPLRGTRFLFDAEQMMTATREIEDAATGELLVGFQLAAKAHRERARYGAIVDRGVAVTAFGAGAGPGTMPWLRWIEVPFDVASVEAQWFLILPAPEPLAFVAYDLAPADRFGVGGATDPERRFAGFVTEDLRVVRALTAHLAQVQARAETVPAVPEHLGRRLAHARTIVAATDDSAGIGGGARRAAIRLAADLGADVILYDRSAESYFVDPYPHGTSATWAHTLDAGEAHILGRGYLADQIREAEMSGVRATAWLPLRPGPAGMSDLIAEEEVDVVVLPQEIEHPSLVDRIRGDVPSRWTAAIDVPVLVSSPTGRLRELDRSLVAS